MGRPSTACPRWRRVRTRQGNLKSSPGLHVVTPRMACQARPCCSIGSPHPAHHIFRIHLHRVVPQLVFGDHLRGVCNIEYEAGSGCNLASLCPLDEYADLLLSP